MLEVQKYIDTRFRTEDSKSDSEFTIGLPRTVNIPDDTMAYMNDIVLPVSSTTIDEPTKQIYYSISHYVSGGYDTSYWILPTDFNNYNGSTLAAELIEKLNDGLYADMKPKFILFIESNYIANQLNIEITDLRSVADQYFKSISVRANDNELIFDSCMAGFDYLDLSRRSFSRIDFRLTDSYGEPSNYKDSHRSMSIIFQIRG